MQLKQLGEARAAVCRVSTTPWFIGRRWEPLHVLPHLLHFHIFKVISDEVLKATSFPGPVDTLVIGECFCIEL